SRDNLNAWIGNSCLMHYLPRLKSILNRNNDVVSCGGIRRSQNIGAGCISPYRLNALVPQLGERTICCIDNKERSAAFLEGRCDDAAHPPATNKNCVVSQRRGLGREVLRRQSRLGVPRFLIKASG